MHAYTVHCIINGAAYIKEYNNNTLASGIFVSLCGRVKQSHVVTMNTGSAGHDMHG